MCWPPRRCCSSAGQEHARHGRRRAAGRRHRQGRDPGDHRQDRHRRRHRLRHRIRRHGDPRPVDGRPHDGLQHVDRGGRARRPDRAGRDHLRLPQGPAVRAQGRRTGSRPSPTGARCRRDAGAHLRHARSCSTPTTSRRRSPGAPARRTCCRSPARVPDPADVADEASAAADGARAGLHGPDARHAADRRRRSTTSSSAPAPTAASRTCARPPRVAKGRKVADDVQAHGRARLRPGEAAGRGGRPRRDLHATPASSGASPAARCAWP